MAAEFNHKILTSARNGELIMWDLNKSGSSKYESKGKDHSRSVHKLSVSPTVHHYCITGSGDGDLRAWDIREIQKSRMRIHHPTGIRGIAFSPSPSQPLQAMVGLDNGSIYRWDLRMGQRGLLDRLLVAHTASVTSLDWYLPEGNEAHSTDNATNLGWIVSSGLDRTVKVWDVSHTNTSTNTTAPAGHIPLKPKYTLHPSFPVRRVVWRPGYGCEVAVISNANAEFGSGNFEIAGPVPTYASALSTKARHPEPDGSPKLTRERERAATGIGDSVEIWDVRRGWIAKWTVRGSSIEGGVTDIAFRDSHAIWATHASGMFSQIDLRDATKPVDAIPRVSVSWEASGTLAFVADRRLSWEVPYDDVDPATHPPTDPRRRLKHFKAIGDAPTKPKSQALGTYANDHPEEVEIFAKLARGYLFEGAERQELCEINAQIAFEVGKTRVAQLWLLLAAALRSIALELPPSPPPTIPSLPVTAALNYTFPPTAGSTPPDSNGSPGRTSLFASPRGDRSTSTSRRLTPTSSNQSSPRLQSGALPPVTPRAGSRPPFLGRRQSQDSGVSISRRPSHYRRPSTNSIPSATNPSPSSTRHVGEGALSDDSDPSSSGSERSAGGDDELDHDDGGSSSENERPQSSSTAPTVVSPSPSVLPTRMRSASRSHPSPLSKIAELTWTETEPDEELEDEESSPSPISSDTEDKSSDDQPGPASSERFKSPLRRHQKSKSSGSAGARRKNMARVKSRSRSSTLASLAAPAVSRTLIHQSSHSSILTVTAAETSFQETASGLKAEETIRDLRTAIQAAPLPPLNSTVENNDEGSSADVPVSESKLTERHKSYVRRDEARMHDLTWDMLREMLDTLTDEGDVQTCAMLALLAPEELRIGPNRTVRFLEAYIDILSRLQLHSCAAYVRKFSRTDDIVKTTLIETQIHTSCGNCRKPLVVSAGSPAAGQLIKGGFAYCISCKSSCATCAICRLPVRTLFFQCAICQHGGHQACYRRWYMEQPMTPIPGSVLENRGRRRARADADIRELLQGHRCAAGCGHFCWAAFGSEAANTS
uniref:WDR59/RTC1-like RING zinc finger domain-containing protein n=1 Tax=Mycena chlorophos TaxID=658473 RepID=A0ABQ0LRK5_MYCCL|nr:predicted protein [Mycena chlorophos]